MKTYWTNFHSHTYYCDGKSSLEDHVIAAIDQNVKSYGFSSHSPVPFPTTWNMKKEKLENYLQDANLLIEKYKGQIQLYKSLEVDFIPQKSGPHQYPQLDYTVGSVHFVDQYEDGTYWEIDNTKTIFRKGLKEIFHDDIQAAIQKYIDLNVEMITTDKPDVLGHLDKIKMHNHTEKLFSEEDNWYQKIMMAYVEEIEKSGVIVEVNTRGLYKGWADDLYPSPWLLKELIQRNIPIVLNSDSHVPHEITKKFSDTAKMLQQLGLKKLYAFWNNEWQPFDFNEDGLYLPNA
ncbi:histidinol-phosphatase [Flammeovirga agarivorans]|uniref:Histidinol-phosphatase n=1 Tax=Flammeovirga agarivorans TaxID=2726742 RepID=A0A7X8XUH6_9BACT|nr:histidinol-phosphatase [Flammeovirga agarivorans]NLR90392.1 histidinol-phosphatase [Flammeovirga agarivorans]